MTKLLLTELFPNFVKKSQTQRLAKGPFGEGLDAAELEKARVYLKPGEQAPEGANVQTGPQGGQYYDEGGGGASAGEGQPSEVAPGPDDMADRQQAAVDQMQQINQQRMAEYQDAQAAGPEALAEWEASDAQRKEGEAAARADIEGLRDARAQGPEAEAAYKDKRKQEESEKYQALVAKVEAELPNTVIEDGPLKGKTFGEVDQELQEFAAKVDMEVGANREKVAKVTELLSGQSQEQRQEGIDAAMADIQARRAQNEAEAAGPPDVSEPAFDGQGNIQTPGSDPYPISELTGSDEEAVNALGEQYQQEGGSNPAELLSGYDGPLTEDGVQEYMQDQAKYEDAFISDNDYQNAIDFASWVGEKAGSGPNPQTLDSPDGLDWERSGFDQEDFHDAIIEAQGSVHNTEMGYSGAQNWMEENGIDINSPLGYKLYDYADRYSRERAQDAADYYGEDYALMEKMMQKYNVDNKRRDPIVLSNKGGRQR